VRIEGQLMDDVVAGMSRWVQLVALDGYQDVGGEGIKRGDDGMQVMEWLNGQCS